MTNFSTQRITLSYITMIVGVHKTIGPYLNVWGHSILEHKGHNHKALLFFFFEYNKALLF